MFFRKCISIFLIALLLIPILSLQEFAYASTPSEERYDENLTVDKNSIENNINYLPTYPDNFQTDESLWTNTIGYYINMELLKDKGKIIYGEPTDLGEANDFWKSPDNTGYYKKDGHWGEYRYHGFDMMGNKYTNIDFPPDALSNLKMSDKQWYYRPWESPTGLPAPPISISPYNNKAIYNSDIKTQEWINEAFRDYGNWTISNGIKKDGSSSNSVNVYDHFHVLSAPDMQRTGEVRGWNKSAYSGRSYYQTLTASTIDDKYLNPIECTVSIVNEDELVLTANEGYITVDVKVTGEIMDENCYDEGVNDPDKPIYYNHEDIKYWTLTLGTNTGYIDLVTLDDFSSEITPAGKGQKYVAYTFKGVKIPRTQLEFDSNLRLTAVATATFIGDESASDSAQATKPVLVEDGNGHMSYFIIENSISLEHGDDLYDSVIGYKDYSLGSISNYEIMVVNNDNGDSITVNYPLVDDLTVCQDIYNFVSQYVRGQDGTEQSDFNFNVSQTITTLDGQTDTHNENLIISIGNLIPIVVEPSVSISTEAYDILPFNARDNTDMSTVASRKVFVNGREVDDDYFFSGSYTFGASSKNLLYFVEVEYESLDGCPATLARWVNVRTTKPKVQFSLTGTFKENRKITLNNTSSLANDPTLLSNYPITYTWNYEAIDGDDSNRRIKDISDLYKELLYKEKGVYRITLHGTNSLGRTANPYSFEFTITEDYEPDITMHIWNNILLRSEKVSINHGVGSIDEDNIISNTLEIYYDTDNDGDCETLLESMDAEDFVDYQPMNLGNYKIVNYVEEEFGQETIPEFIDESDKKIAIKERYFFVENARPMTKLYTDVPLDFPQLDLFIMTDENLDRTKNDIIRNTRIDYKNYLMSQSIVADVQVWDMHTYTYSQNISTSRITGSSYPSSTLNYSSGGYEGILSRTNVTNNRYQVDEGYYKTVTMSDSKTATGTASGYGDSWYDADGNLFYTSGTSQPSISYNSGGYTGTLYKTGYSLDRTETTNFSNGVTRIQRYYTGYYSGTVTKTWTEQVWVSNWVWHNNYTGYYSGTIYKDIAQEYSNPFEALTDKYLVYVSDDGINQMDNLNMVLENADVKLILVGDPSIQSQIDHDYFFENNKPMDEIMIDVLRAIETENPYEVAYKILQGQSFTIDTANYDEEGDPIVEEYYQYVHEPNVFDNNQGMESYATDSYSEDSNWIDFKATQFNKKGYYEIYRRIKDNPSNDSNFSDFSMYSNQPMLSLIVHEEPIADCTLDWDYNPTTLKYETTWVDESYDPDHEFNRPDKGIAERKIMYREAGGEWIYMIPDNLSPGDYELQYYVKDIEGAWSNPYIMNFTLSPNPTIQLNASARALDNDFSLASIPASEYLEIYNIWTRYPYPHRLEVALYNGGTNVSPITTMNYYTGTKDDNDIDWDNMVYEIPQTLEDGAYTLKLTAIDTSNGSINEEVNFNVSLSTPVELDLTFVPYELIADETNVIEVETSKYVDEVGITLYEETAYEVVDYMTLKKAGKRKIWTYEYYPTPGLVPEGDYTAKFVATTPNNNSQSKTSGYKQLDVKLEDLRIVLVCDFGWQHNFEKTNGNPTNLQTFGIRTKDFPLLHNDKLKFIKLGYAVDFEIDSTGLNNPGDKINVIIHYFAEDKYGQYQPVDIYIPDDNYNYLKLENSEYVQTSKSFVLSDNHKRAFEDEPTNPNKNTWEFSMFLPPTAKVVKRGEALNLFNDNTYDRRLLVLLDIEAEKASGATYDYTLKETDWAIGNGYTYGMNKPSGLNLLGKGVNHGEVFFYDLDDTLLDDLKIHQEW